ncbi:nucleotidyltransferase family protein [Actimicrobium sp. CCC2.4]|uniref:nucleotidyltransferase family protein n=1 Tax=Actimicrobium sp. CCC2.4 TaxID=3048606 RepID=UPI002AC9953F|nr:nucleotidyltransferase family protein [Actimicrobium sp. CCC2.4]MEB0135543.1 nucleotidyltransferase family protein [Actimicrobium sp. CCC2.4]WPX32289.1 nucleotidyltransferase family protein [Actimicrobium sp. CCC2.4]
MHCTGLLLAAGRGRRFDPSGLQNKLLQILPQGEHVALRSAQRLAQALTSTLVVVHPDALRLMNLLHQSGFATSCCADAAAGMGHTLAHGVRSSAAAPGWIVALADMPHVKSSTIAALDAAIRDGADIAVPVHQGRRGNPVGFSRLHQQALLDMHGDQGAREVVRVHPVVEVEVDDPGILFDIDTPDDLKKAG